MIRLGSRWRRTARVLAVMAAALALGAAATTPVAAGKADRATWWVDDDGTVGTDSCDGSRATRTKIQITVEVADRWDTVKVCPGTYDEEVELKGSNTRGMTLMSVVKHGAVIKSIKVENGADVTVRGFAWVFDPTDDCGSTGVVAGGVRVTVQGMRLTFLPLDSTHPERCSAIGISAGGTSLIIRDNVLTGALDGIRVDGLATVTGNTITSAATLRDSDDDRCQGTALSVLTETVEARSRVSGNTIHGPRPGGGVPRPRVWCAGIQVEQRVDAIDNVVSGAEVGIESAERTLVEGNTINHTVTGIKVRELGTIRRNVVRTSQIGVRAGAFRTRFIENDLRGNSGLDCMDTSDPNNSAFPENFGTGNQWLRNRGLDAAPAPICKRSWS